MQAPTPKYQVIKTAAGSSIALTTRCPYCKSDHGIEGLRQNDRTGSYRCPVTGYHFTTR